MKKSKIDLFFQELAKSLDTPAEVILTGAAAGVLMGNVRPSQDVDFEIRFKQARELGEKLGIIMEELKQKTGLDVNYSEDISHWSMISFLDYRQGALPYKKFGLLEVKIIAPSYWTIGKMSRFYELDIRDMIKVIRNKKIRPESLIELWAKALHSSPLSLSTKQFHDHVLYFLKTHGKEVWGGIFQADPAIEHFKKAIANLK
jgi:hypothetical protein